MEARILVLGGTGFIGRHAVAELNAQQQELTIGTRAPQQENHLHVRFEEMTHPEDWAAIAQEFDVILNCVGILRPQRSSTYEIVHHLAPKAIAEACSKTNTRFIHISALGLSRGDRSGFLTSKLNGEEAIQATNSNWIIARPSLLDGEGGYGAAWLRGVSKLPLFASPMDAKGQIAALMVTDLGEALAKLCLAGEEELKLHQSRIFELGGMESYNFKNYIRGLRRRYSKSTALAIPLPGIVARLGAHLCDLFSFSPFSFGHWELLRKHNAPTENRLPELLGRAPAVVVPEQD